MGKSYARSTSNKWVFRAVSETASASGSRVGPLRDFRFLVMLPNDLEARSLVNDLLDLGYGVTRHDHELA
jgi:hypothetical protein